MSKYEPELGQHYFGAKYSEYECPEYIIALLEHLGWYIKIIEENRTQQEFPAPTRNHGTQYKTGVFEMSAYYWGEHEDGNRDCPCCKPNFKFGDFEVRWYKHLGRGTSMNRSIEPPEAVEIFKRCWESLEARDKEAYDDQR